MVFKYMGHHWRVRSEPKQIFTPGCNQPQKRTAIKRGLAPSGIRRWIEHLFKSSGGEWQNDRLDAFQ